MSFGFGFGQFGFGTRQGGGVKTVEELFAERSVILDFENDTFFWDGEAKTIGDLTDTEQGYASGAVDWFGSAYSVVIDYTIDQSAVTEGCMLSIASTPTTTRRFEILQKYSNSRNVNFTQIFPTAFPYAPYTPTAISEGGKGRARAAMAVKVGQIMSACVDNYRAGAVSAAALTAVAGTQCFIGYRHISTPDQEFGGTIHAIHIWPRKLTDTELRKVTRFGAGAGFPLHMVGDSFANDNIISMFMKENFATYVPLSLDAAGGNNMEQHAARFAATPWYHDSTLVVVEGGLDTSGIDTLGALNEMIARLSHDRWVISEPGMNTDLTPGSPARIEQDAHWDAIVAAHPNNIVGTRDALAAAGDGSEDDNADIANGFTPRSLRIDGIHLSTEGSEIYADQIAAEITARGWDTGDDTQLSRYLMNKLGIATTRTGQALSEMIAAGQWQVAEANQPVFVGGTVLGRRVLGLMAQAASTPLVEDSDDLSGWSTTGSPDVTYTPAPATYAGYLYPFGYTTITGTGGAWTVSKALTSANGNRASRIRYFAPDANSGDILLSQDNGSTTVAVTKGGVVKSLALAQQTSTDPTLVISGSGTDSIVIYDFQHGKPASLVPVYASHVPQGSSPATAGATIYEKLTAATSFDFSFLQVLPTLRNSPTIFNICNGSTRILDLYWGSGGALVLRRRVGGVDATASVAGLSGSVGAVIKIDVQWTDSVVRFRVNNGTWQAATYGALPTVDRFRFCVSQTGAEQAAAPMLAFEDVGRTFLPAPYGWHLPDLEAFNASL